MKARYMLDVEGWELRRYEAPAYPDRIAFSLVREDGRYWRRILDFTDAHVLRAAGWWWERADQALEEEDQEKAIECRVYALRQIFPEADEILDTRPEVAA